MDEDLIINDQPQEPLIEEPQVEEPKPLEYKDPEVEDTYNKSDDEQARDKFMKDLEEKYPIKGNASLQDVDTKDPQAVKKFFDDMQNNTRIDLENKEARKKAIEEFDARQENKHWEAAYKAYPKLRQDDETRRIVDIVAKGAGCSPLASANFVNKLITQVYNQGFNAARSHTQTVPSKPLGSQQQSAPVKLNKKAMNERLNYGNDDDIAEVVAAASKAGIGGL